MSSFDGTLGELFFLLLLLLQAGGIATTGRGRILDVVPTGIHERSSVFLGSRDDVTDLLKFYEQETNGI